MVLDLELIQFYRCSSLEELMQRAVSVSTYIGFPLNALTWTPAPAPDAKMLNNYIPVADNYDQALGANGRHLRDDLMRSMAIALAKKRADTKACQKWQLTQRGTFKVFDNAPSDFFLTTYQKTLLRDHSDEDWMEFFTIPVCRERDRTLFFTAKASIAVTEAMANNINSLLEAFAGAYRFLYIKALQPVSYMTDQRPARALSSREVECLQWLASGKTLSEAAIILGISERTLRYHIGNARERLGVATTVQAVVAAALSYGFDPEDPRRSVFAASRPQTV